MGGSRFYRSFSLYCVIHWSKLPSQETGERRIKIRTGKGPRDADCDRTIGQALFIGKPFSILVLQIQRVFYPLFMFFPFVEKWRSRKKALTSKGFFSLSLFSNREGVRERRRRREREREIPEEKTLTDPLVKVLSWDSILLMNSIASCKGLVSSSRYFTNIS